MGVFTALRGYCDNNATRANSGILWGELSNFAGKKTDIKQAPIQEVSRTLRIHSILGDSKNPGVLISLLQAPAPVS